MFLSNKISVPKIHKKIRRGDAWIVLEEMLILHFLPGCFLFNASQKYNLDDAQAYCQGVENATLIEIFTEEQQMSVMLAQEARRSEDWTQSDPLKASQGWRLSRQEVVTSLARPEVVLPTWNSVLIHSPSSAE